MGEATARRAETGGATYDQARWSAPPAEARLLASSPAGVDFIYQRGSSVDPTVATQEVLAPAASTYQLLLLPRLRDLSVWLQGDAVRVASGDRQLVVIAAGMSSRWLTGADFGDAVHLHVTDGFLASLEDEATQLPALVGGMLDVGGRGAAVYDAVVNEARLGRSTALRAESLARLLLTDLAEERRPEPAGLTPLQIRRVRDFVAARLDAPPTLGEMAAVAGRSPSHFARAFRTTLGLTPSAYVEAQRMEAAKAQLSAGAAIMDVALGAGYASRSAFGAAFRRATGMTPADWRRATR